MWLPASGRLCPVLADVWGWCAPRPRPLVGLFLSEMDANEALEFLPGLVNGSRGLLRRVCQGVHPRPHSAWPVWLDSGTGNRRTVLWLSTWSP